MCVVCVVCVFGILLLYDVVVDVFECFGFMFSVDGDVFIVELLLYCFDLEIEEDLIEEVVCIYGFEQIFVKLLVVESVMCLIDEVCCIMYDVCYVVVVCDYYEVVNFVFVESEWEVDFVGNINLILLLNLIVSQYLVMCSMFIGGLFDKVCYNVNCKVLCVCMFEVGCVFYCDVSVVDGGLLIVGYV